jgi:RND family efflux transporter MFP subunit
MKQCPVKEQMGGINVNLGSVKTSIGKAAGAIGRLGRRAGRFAKKHKLLTAVLVLFLIAIVAFGVMRVRRNRKPQMEMNTVVETATIEKMDLSNSISVTGTIASAESKTGTTSLNNLTVTAVYVEVGDEVQEGDIICTFDASDIEEALATAKNNYRVNQQLDALNDYTTQYTDTIADAEDALQDARDTRDAYKSAYQNAVSAEESAKSTASSKASAAEAAKKEYESAKTALQEAAQAYENSDQGSKIVVNDIDAYIKNLSENSEEGSAYNTLKTELNAYNTAKSKYESAQSASEAAQSAYEKAKTATSQAESAYEQAQEERERAQDTYESTVEQAEDTYEKAKLNDQLITDDNEKNQIEEYEEQLSDCTVYAAMSGTITALNVEEGETFNGGSIYEIQDMSYFIVEASVDEYDIVDIAKGMTAYVKTDATGDEELEAEVTYVAPTGTSGMTMGSASGTASYQIQITISDPQTRLRAGMTAQASIALEESKDALAVPYDCVQTNPDGQSVIYVDDNGERKEIQVETGIETSYYTEVISDELEEGMTVYLSTQMINSSKTEQSDQDQEDGALDSLLNMGGGSAPSGGGGNMGGGGGGAPSGGGGNMGGGPGGF